MSADQYLVSPHHHHHHHNHHHHHHHQGVVFDLPSKFDTMVKVSCLVCVCVCVCVCVLQCGTCVQEHWQDTERVQLSVPSSLPDLKDRPPDFLDRMRANSRPGGKGVWSSSIYSDTHFCHRLHQK